MGPSFLFYAFCYILIIENYSIITLSVIAEGWLLLNLSRNLVQDSCV